LKIINGIIEIPIYNQKFRDRRISGAKKVAYRKKKAQDISARMV